MPFVWDQRVGRKDLIKKFEVDYSWKEMQLQLTNHEQVFWHCFPNLLLVNVKLSRLRIILHEILAHLSKILNWKGCLSWSQNNFKQPGTQTFLPYILTYPGLDYLKICLRSFNSVKLKWKGCLRIISSFFAEQINGLVSIW